MATTVPAIKPLVTRYFPNILGHNFSRHGLSSDGHVKSLEPYPERSYPERNYPVRSAKCPLQSSGSNFVKIPSPEFTASEKNGPQAKSRPLILKPVVSAFSTYGKEEPARPIADLKTSNQMEGESPNTSISSSNAMWMPK
jgi:hypothetical protein